MVIKMNLKELRQSLGIKQIEAAKFLNVPIRTYKNYENDANKMNSIKYQYMYTSLEKYNYIDEENGILQIKDIIKIVNEVFKNYDINYCYLFGSYAKGTATSKSDVDLLICSTLTGLKFYGLAESLREALKKKVDLLNLSQLENNIALTDEILKYGIKIYGDKG